MVVRARRLLAYAWAAPNSAVGLIFGLVMLALGGRVDLVAGTLEFSGGLPWRYVGRWSVSRHLVDATTLGHVVLGRSRAELSALRLHERVHVRQYERWGVFFLPAYTVSSMWQLLNGRRGYRDNHFERQAYKSTAD